MVHCGYEPTAVSDAINHPIKAIKVAFGGVNTEKPMVKEESLDGQRKAEHVFEDVINQALTNHSSNQATSSDNSSYSP